MNTLVSICAPVKIVNSFPSVLLTQNSQASPQVAVMTITIRWDPLPRMPSPQHGLFAPDATSDPTSQVIPCHFFKWGLYSFFSVFPPPSKSIHTPFWIPGLSSEHPPPPQSLTLFSEHFLHLLATHSKGVGSPAFFLSWAWRQERSPPWFWCSQAFVLPTSTALGHFWNTSHGALPHPTLPFASSTFFLLMPSFIDNFST